MLTPEQAQQILDNHRIDSKKALQRQLDAIRRLPNALRHSAYALIDHDKNGKRIDHGFYDWNNPPEHVIETRKRQNEALWRLEHMESETRKQVFGVFLPKISGYIELAWNFSKKLPYQSGYVRKAFRAPTRPEISFWKRVQWIKNIIQHLSSYDEDLVWLAQYSPYMSYGTAAYALAIVLAAAIDSDSPIGDEIFEILVASAKGEHEVGIMGRHVPRALLSASRPGGWEFVERLLLAAQREEGLRQVILETIDEAHPEAFKRMLGVILQNNLARFSAVTRAMGVWLGFMWDSENTRIINSMLSTLLDMLTNPDQRRQALKAGEGEAVYLALWTIAFEDAHEAIPLATKLLNDEQVERRFAALHLLANLNLQEASAAMMPALDDEDLRLVTYTCQAYRRGPLPEADDLFEKIEAALTRMPDQPKTGAPIIWDWLKIESSQEAVAHLLLGSLGDRSPKRLIPYMNVFQQYDHVNAAKKLAASGISDPEVRDAVLKLVGDRSGWVRESAIEIMAKQPILAEDAPYLEGLLTRKANDLRRGILKLLISQKDADVLASADRLIESKKPLQRLAGLELLHLLVQKDRVPGKCKERAKAYRHANSDAGEIETSLIELILKQDEVEVTLKNALGLIDPAERSKPSQPTKRNIDMLTPAAIACLISLDDFIHEHRNEPLMVNTWQGEQEVLLGNASYAFPKPDASTPVEQDIHGLPLRELWERWYQERPSTLRDPDHLELLRAWQDIDPHNGTRTALPSEEGNQSYDTPVVERLKTCLSNAVVNLIDKESKCVQMRYGALVEKIIVWLIRSHEPPGGATFLLDSLEASYATISSKLKRLAAEKEKQENWGGGWNSPYSRHLQTVRYYRSLCNDWTTEHHVRLFNLLGWLNETTLSMTLLRVQLEEVLWAYEAQAATQADIYFQLFNPQQLHYYGGRQFHDVRMLSSKTPHPLLSEYPILKEIYEACRERLLEVELKRGEMPTVASAPAMALRSVYGIDWFVRIVQALGKDNLARGYTYNSQSRSTVFSHLLRVSFPAEKETLEQFATAVKKAKITQKRLIEAAIYAPQWANYVEHALNWEGFADAVWWIHAHTKDNKWYVDAEISESWQAQVSERTALTGQDLLAGAVDVQWFWYVYETLGEKRWTVLYKAAKYSSGGGGHTRAKLFADAMLGEVEREAVVKRMTQKRHQDSVRALGLLPLPEDELDAELLSRYQIMQEFLRTSRKFGSQRQESEKLAVRIGMENLARTAGYPDPLRLQWAMEAQEVADLREGSVSAKVEDVTLTLHIDEVGKPHLDIRRGDKKLKSIPAKFRKVEAFVELRERKKAIEKQHSRMRIALESAMCREDAFATAELSDLLQHPILAPMLQQLVFITENRMGYPVDGANSLLRFDGSAHSLPADAVLRIAHAYDLYQSGDWSEWQRECFLAERIQPFKQVFRELYVLTEAEKLDGAISRRYAGHQVQPRQASALLGSRGWVSRPEEGVQRTFHKQKLAAFITFLQGFYTPAEVEGLTIEGVVFVEPGRSWKPLPLADVPPILFSEVMRDLDLVVSVAHRGGVDPEATASTVEMRAALIRETCALLKIENIDFRGNHALIEGKLGSYSVHLGSAVVHRQPGGALCIIPVHAQHRGRIFLPFADDDPKTAEVISKALLLARDNQIKDPTILEQIYA